MADVELNADDLPKGMTPAQAVRLLQAVGIVERSYAETKANYDDALTTVRELQRDNEYLREQVAATRKEVQQTKRELDGKAMRVQALEKELTAVRSNWGEEVNAKDKHLEQLSADVNRHLNAWYAMREENRKLRRTIKDLKGGDKKRDPDQEFVDGISAGGSFTAASAQLFLDAMRNAGYTYEPIPHA